MLALEMGGNNPLIIGEIDDLQAAAYLIFQSAFLSSGQRCTCARRLIVPDSPLTEKLLQILIDMIRHVTIGCYDQKPEPFMGPLITEKHAEHILLAQEQLVAKWGAVPYPLQTIAARKSLSFPRINGCHTHPRKA